MANTEPQRIQDFVKESLATGADIVSGSRYLKEFDRRFTATGATTPNQPPSHEVAKRTDGF